RDRHLHMVGGGNADGGGDELRKHDFGTPWAWGGRSKMFPDVQQSRAAVVSGRRARLCHRHFPRGSFRQHRSNDAAGCVGSTARWLAAVFRYLWFARFRLVRTLAEMVPTSGIVLMAARKRAA